MECTKNMDSVFDQSMEDTKEFDAMFDQEDDLVDIVCGYSEGAEPLDGVDFDQLHQTHDDATAEDVLDGEADDEFMGAKYPEGTEEIKLDDVSVKGELDKESEADKFIGDPDDDYQNDKEKNVTPDENDIESTIDKVAESGDDCDIDDEIMNDDDDDFVQESDTIDADVSKIDDADLDGEDDTIEDAENDSDAGMSDKYSYDVSDEELIDIAMNTL